MNVSQITEQTLEPFREYCRIHRYAHDESYLYEEDMSDFQPFSGLHPTMLLLDDLGTILGALSLMLDDYFLAGGKSRIRIFHCVSGDPSHYRMLFDALPAMDPAISIIEAFLPECKTLSIDIFKSLGFEYYRTSYVMVRKDLNSPVPAFPQGYSLKPFVIGTDEIHYANIRNTAFRGLKGSEAPISMELVRKITTEDYLLEDGVQLLWHHDTPVGLIRIEEDEDSSGKFSFIAPIALLPDYQGKGLGTQLLKAGIAISDQHGLTTCKLCVNAENDQALGLYKKAGFRIEEAIGCYHHRIDVDSDQ